ncbi:Apelin receptor [Trichoplax sp. H2]|nr:Apelin receptor [Trichoplax sp. H2]|eukprot:RDD43184.1 Apelin receptor [Trichoplax sp. H2]
MTNTSRNNNFRLELAAQIYQYAAVVGIPIFTFGLIINLFILYLFLFDKHFQKTTYKLMCISVISDIISTMASLAGYIQIVIRNLDYDGGTFMCRMVLFFLFSSFGVSMMNLCLIGIDRYFIIVKPLSSFYRNYKIYVLVLGEIAIWISAVATNAPIFDYVAVHHSDNLLCDIPNITTSVSVYLIADATVLFIIPTILMIIIYSRIISFQKSYQRPGESIRKQLIAEQIKKKRFMKMLTWISVSYVMISWPYFATILGMAVTRQSTLMIRDSNIVYFLFSFFSVTITTSIVILNPFIYLKFDLSVRNRSLVLIRKFQPFHNSGRNHRLVPVTSTGPTNTHMSSPRL